MQIEEGETDNYRQGPRLDLLHLDHVVIESLVKSENRPVPAIFPQISKPFVAHRLGRGIGTFINQHVLGYVLGELEIGLFVEARDS